MSNEKLDVVACQHRFWKLLSKHATEVREDLFDNGCDARAGRLCAEGLRIRALAHTSADSSRKFAEYYKALVKSGREHTVSCDSGSIVGFQNKKQPGPATRLITTLVLGRKPCEQSRRRNDDVEYRAFGRFGPKQCP